MKNIAELDKNFMNASTARDNMVIHDIEEPCFDIYGVFKPENESEFIRIPRDVAAATSEGVAALNINTSGGRVRFRTNSKYVALKCVLPYIGLMPHMPLTGSSCFDLYADGKYVKTFIPDWTFIPNYYSRYKEDPSAEYEAIVEFPERKLQEITINFPLYNGVSKVFIGVEDSAVLENGAKYTYPTPVVFYGSSITQGGCVSRPGNCYANILSRRFDFDFINLGFSGNARGEDAIADHIASLDMSMFIYDYDHNAPTNEHLRNTHYKMYRKIRDKHPYIPIIMASRPSDSGTLADIAIRIQIIEETLSRAIAEGDRNIYFINGMTQMFPLLDEQMMTVDRAHPNDLGSYCMADAFEKIIKQVYPAQ